MHVIGLTGGIGAGKDTVAGMLRSHGAVIIDADEIARGLLVPGSSFLAAVVDEFGPEILRADGTLNRAALAKIVFANPSARKRLEALTHPAVLAETARRIEALRTSPHPPPVAIIMAPLLFEAHAETMCEKVIVVTADAATRLARLQARDNLSETDLRARMSAQMPEAEKLTRADWVIDNSGSLEEAKNQVEKVWGEVNN
jgi:dephospho-CoA kinase